MSGDVEPIDIPVTQPVGTDTNQQQIIELEDTIVSKSGEGSYSAVSFKDDPSTEKVTEQGLYINTLDISYYDITYFEPNGTITILLYQEPLSFARSLAEEQLKSLFPYTEEELCDMQVSVRTNKMVSPEFSPFELGMSFCPGSHDLEL